MKWVLTLAIIEVHLDPFENVGADYIQRDVAATTYHGRDQGLQIKSVKYVLCVQFFLVDIFQRLLKDLLKLVKIWLLVLLACGRFTCLILVAL
jgi:hypothetical protein